MATPRFITPRRSPYSYAPKVALLADRAFGRPFMPWQHQASGLIEECDADGWLLNPLVVITVPRQSGKTELVKGTAVRRVMSRPKARIWYTAQTGIKAREQFTELIDDVELSPLRSGFKCLRGAGDTSINLPPTGGRFRAFPPTPDSLHSSQSDLVILDEAWFFDEDLAEGIMGAIGPTQATRGRKMGVRPGPQIIVVSTMGTAKSTWFHGLVDRGRAGEPGIALIDYGIGPDVDPLDDEAIAAAHPAIGHTQSMDVLTTGRAQLSPGEFTRAYGNRPTSAFDRLIPAEVAELATVTADLPAGQPSFGAAVSFERDEAAIVSCVIDAAGVPWVEVVLITDATDDLVGKLTSVTSRNGGHVVIDGNGPASSLAESADRAGAIVTKVGTAELASATADMLDRLRKPLTESGTAPAVRLRAHPAFTDALDAATLRTVGDRQVLARRGSAAPITVLEAAVLAVRAALTKPKPPVAPKVWI